MTEPAKGGMDSTICGAEIDLTTIHDSNEVHVLEF